MIALLAPRRFRLAADHRRRFGAIGSVTHVTARASFVRFVAQLTARANGAYQSRITQIARRAGLRAALCKETDYVLHCCMSALAGLIFQERKPLPDLCLFVLPFWKAPKERSGLRVSGCPPAFQRARHIFQSRIVTSTMA
jgi:hypothetical protein